MSEKTIRFAEADCRKEDCEALRNEVITLRDSALAIGHMIFAEADCRTAVMLSHVIAFMAVAIEELYKENQEDDQVNPV